MDHPSTDDAAVIKTVNDGPPAPPEPPAQTEPLTKPASAPKKGSLDFPSGTKVGRYVLRQVIGRGGMGVVYAAFDPDLNRRIAIKILNPSKDGKNDSEDAKKRLLREAQAMAQIEHPNMVQVFDVGEFAESIFIAMEFISGRTLREWNAEIQPSDWKEILKVYSCAGVALQAAHDVGLVHRDFKPDNVMLGFDSRVRVMDFGLARPVKRGIQDIRGTLNTTDVLTKTLTQTGVVMGTPAYMAPEQFIGDDADSKTDQFAFCVSLFEALYGHRPFKGRKMTEIAKSVVRGTVTLPNRRTPVPGWVLDVLLKGLQTNPSDRWESMEELLEALKGPQSSDRYYKIFLFWFFLIAALIGLTFYAMSAQQKEIRDLEKAETRKHIETLEQRILNLQQQLGKAPAVGSLTDEQILSVVRAYDTDILVCSSLNLAGTRVGQVELSVKISEKGSAESVSVLSSTVDPRIARCVQGLVLTWDFPPPSGGRAIVKIPIRMSPETKATP